MSARVAPFGTWSSPVTSSLAAAGAIRLGGLLVDGDDLLWLESRPQERGRNALLRWRAGAVHELLPTTFNVRTRVHEYGGGSFTAANGTIFFVNDADQRIWRCDPDRPPRPITPEAKVRYADLELDLPRQRLIAVREDHRTSTHEPANELVAVDLDGRGEPRVLVSGADFYAFPRLHPDGRTLAWLSWRHPHMPWQSTELWMALVERDGTLGAARLIAGGAGESIFQPAWSPGGVLHFISDRTGFSNLYRWSNDRVEPLHARNADFGYPLWVFGLSTYTFLDDQRIACTFQQDGIWRLGLFQEGAFTDVEVPLTEIGYVRSHRGRVVFVGSSASEPWGIHAVEAGQHHRLHVTSRAPLAGAYVSRPQPISFPTSDGATAHGLFYPPTNPDHEGPAAERPPLLVLSHGGPTACASTAFSLSLQFWTTRGFAVLDVNYRGSSGYGRAYREALDGRWGIYDVDDCAAGALHLAKAGLVDPTRLLIRGGSAGGFTTLAALTFRDVFRAGASHYGVSDLEALVRDTHKFEARYLDSLIGPYPARLDLYHERSPLHHVDRLARPVIFFQGLEDKVVPPDQAERMVQALRARSLPVEYVTFPDEQHGFRRAENISRALDAELSFYLRVFGVTAA